jgi:hypothetical protein
LQTFQIIFAKQIRLQIELNLSQLSTNNTVLRSFLLFFHQKEQNCFPEQKSTTTKADKWVLIKDNAWSDSKVEMLPLILCSVK